MILYKYQCSALNGGNSILISAIIQFAEFQNFTIIMPGTATLSMIADLKNGKLKNGVLYYSLWSGYRTSEYQRRFESELLNLNFSIENIHTSGHASVSNIKQLIDELSPKRIVPIHKIEPEEFLTLRTMYS